jgi:branched-chain amino acid transport system substrate-binding protein
MGVGCWRRDPVACRTPTLILPLRGGGSRSGAQAGSESNIGLSPALSRTGGRGSALLFRRCLLALLFSTTGLGQPLAVFAQAKKYGPGVDDREIKLGQTMPHSGPISALSAVGKAELAYFDMLNASGGVNGRKINLISLDDGYNPAKTVEHTRALVEKENVLALFSSLGGATNGAIHKYVNDRKIPHLFIASNLMRWADPRHFPWTIQSIRPPFYFEAQVYARYILRARPSAKIAILYFHEDSAKDYLEGFKNALGDKATAMIVAEATHDYNDPTVDSQIVTLKASGADTLLTLAGPKHAAMAIRKVHDIGWRPLQIVPFFASSIEAVLKPAGLEKSIGLISSAVAKDPSDPQWRDDPAVKDYLAWAKKWYTHGDAMAWDNVIGYSKAQLMAEILRRCGDDLTRDNLLNQAVHIKHLQLPMMLPGITIDLSPDDYLPIEQLQLIRFDGKQWVRFGEIVGR